MRDQTRVPPSELPTGSGESEQTEALLLYDGLCGFCDRTVRFILRHDRHGSMRFAPLQGPTARAILDRHPELEGLDSLILVEGSGSSEAVQTRSEAVLGVGAYLGGIWGVSGVIRIVPRRLRDWAYTLFARHRHTVFGRFEACPMPSSEVRARFLP